MTGFRVLFGLILLALAPRVAPAQAAISRLVIAGTIEDSVGTPVSDVRIAVIGTDVQAVSDAKGRFRLPELRAGSYVLRMRRLGYEPFLVPIDLPLADDSPLSIELREAPTDLAPVTVKADGISERLAATGFANRRETSGAPPSQFVTRADFERVGPVDLSQMLRRMTGRANKCSDGIIFVDGVLMTRPIQDALPSASAATTSLLNSPNAATAGTAARRAIQEIAKTGVATPKPVALDLIPQNWIEGMEVYASPAQIPNEYRAAFREAKCVILLWTR